MDTVEALKQDVKEGRISAERLVDLVADLGRKLEAANQRNEALNRRIEERGDGEGRRTILDPGRRTATRGSRQEATQAQAEGTTRSRLHRRQSRAR